jgi:hypothetical protein
MSEVHIRPADEYLTRGIDVEGVNRILKGTGYRIEVPPVAQSPFLRDPHHEPSDPIVGDLYSKDRKSPGVAAAVTLANTQDKAFDSYGNALQFANPVVAAAVALDNQAVDKGWAEEHEKTAQAENTKRHLNKLPEPLRKHTVSIFASITGTQGASVESVISTLEKTFGGKCTLATVNDEVKS